MKILLVLSLFLLTACGKGESSNSSPASAAIVQSNPSQPALFCKDQPSCMSQCYVLYPFQEEGQITSYYNSRGLLNSSLYQQALQANRKFMDHYASCLGAQIN